MEAKKIGKCNGQFLQEKGVPKEIRKQIVVVYSREEVMSYNISLIRKLYANKSQLILGLNDARDTQLNKNLILQKEQNSNQSKGAAEGTKEE